MYYRGWNHDGKTQKQLHPVVVCYAESNDGIGWKRPKLGLVEFKGTKNNNIILSEFGTHNFTPFKDANPKCPAEAMYKAVARGEGSDNKAPGFAGRKAHSQFLHVCGRILAGRGPEQKRQSH